MDEAINSSQQVEAFQERKGYAGLVLGGYNVSAPQFRFSFPFLPDEGPEGQALGLLWPQVRSKILMEQAKSNEPLGVAQHLLVSILSKVVNQRLSVVPYKSFDHLHHPRG